LVISVMPASLFNSAVSVLPSLPVGIVISLAFW
jgi:hypothetical protein